MISDLTNICCENSVSDQAILQLFNDKCFKIVEKDKTTGKFCLDEFAFPADGYSCISIEVAASGGEHVIFDNGIDVSSPPATLTADTLYVRGLMLYITYPTKDVNGDELSISNKKVTLSVEDVAAASYRDHSIYNLFTIFTNPKSNVTLDLINRIKIANSSALFKVDIKGLIIYGKTPA